MDYQEIIIDGVPCGGMMEINESWGAIRRRRTGIATLRSKAPMRQCEKIKANGGNIKVPAVRRAGRRPNMRWQAIRQGRRLR